LAAAGTQTTAVAFGGQPNSPNATEEYDGTSWTAGGNLNNGRYNLAGAGLQTAALAAGGSGAPTTNLTELYDGTSWASAANMITGNQEFSGAGTQTSGITFPGESGLTNTQEFTGGPVVVTRTVTGT
jgi:hypothetical protein